MQKYIGTKVINATPMNAGEAKLYFNREVTGTHGDVDSDPGYLVVYDDGYESWSPKHVFDKAYRPVTGMTFGLAIEALQQGCRITRKGWNGSNMFLFYLEGGSIPATAIRDPKLREVFEENAKQGVIEALPSIRMWTADGKVLTGWLASLTDIFATDWEVIE